MGLEEREAITQGWNGKEYYAATRSSGDSQYLKTANCWRRTGVSPCSPSCPGRMFSLTPSYLVSRWALPSQVPYLTWMSTMGSLTKAFPCRSPYHPFLQPTDWLALSRTCKSCNKMVGLQKNSILLNFEHQVAEFIKQNKRLVFPPDSGCARIFKLLTRFLT